ncbi:MAG: PQQ-binding-like beta-propeller repeat protein [Planctomycetia bacterium]|nr:PQQ-binding-like beta-propeller repeat protein [Planctomycetia bacterium]
MLRFLSYSSCRLAVVALTLGVVLGAPASPAAAELSWPEKSGPTCDGRAAAADIVGLPTEWSETKNIAWKIPLEDEGHSVPVIGDGRIWFTAASHDGKKQFVYCVDPATGKVLHHKLLFENEKPEPLNNAVNTYASPSCVLEHDALYVHFGSYGTAKLDPTTAEVVWQRRDMPARHYRGPGSSPFVFENLLILTFDGVDRQYITALDKQTGKTIWETKRSHDYQDLNEKGEPRGEGDLRKAYNTPTLTMVAGKPQLVSVASRAAFGYDPRTGREIWMFEHPNFNAAPRALFLPGLAIINTGSEGANLIGLRLDETTQGNVTKSHFNWHRKKGNSALSSPVLVDGKVYHVTNQGVIYCVDGKSGEEVWSKRVGGSFCASPAVAGNLIYFCDEKGKTIVVRAGSEFTEVAINELGDGMRSSPAIAGGALYLRTFGFLYKIATAK